MHGQKENSEYYLPPPDLKDVADIGAYAKWAQCMDRENPDEVVEQAFLQDIVNVLSRRFGEKILAEGDYMISVLTLKEGETSQMQANTQVVYAENEIDTIEIDDGVSVRWVNDRLVMRYPNGSDVESADLFRDSRLILNNVLFLDTAKFYPLAQDQVERQVFADTATDFREFKTELGSLLAFFREARDNVMKNYSSTPGYMDGAIDHLNQAVDSYEKIIGDYSAFVVSLKNVYTFKHNVTGDRLGMLPPEDQSRAMKLLGFRCMPVYKPTINGTLSEKMPLIAKTELDLAVQRGDELAVELYVAFTEVEDKDIGEMSDGEVTFAKLAGLRMDRLARRGEIYE